MKMIFSIMFAMMMVLGYAESFERDNVTYTILSREEKTVEVTTYKIDLLQTNLDAIIPSSVC